MEYSSTSTLLQEISTLRSRLKDLEDDKSSVVLGPNLDGADSTFMMMRKDIAKLQEEKANQEMEFLNQMTRLQVEKQKEVDELTQKLDKAIDKEAELDGLLSKAREEINGLRATVEVHKICGSEEQFSINLNDLKEAHAKEMDQMKENLLSADREISESRSEIDALQEELDEMQNHRQALLDEVTSARMDLNQEQERANWLQTELTNAKANLENKTIENEKLLSNIRVLESQSKSVPHAVNTLKVSTLQTVSTDSEESPISPTEHSRLINDMQELEDRLVKFHTKLAEKDSKIDDLTASLAREKALNKQLRCAETKSTSPQVTPSATSSVRSIGVSSAPSRSKKPAVAGLVASFERRLVNGVADEIEQEDDLPPSASFDSVMERADASIMKRKLKNEKELVSKLKASLSAEKETVAKLTEELRVERNAMADLRSRVEFNSKRSNEDSQMTQDIEKLRFELHEAKNAQLTSLSLGAKERSELSRLRSEAVYAKVIRDDLESKLHRDDQELERLRVKLTAIEHRGLCQDEKKDYDDDEVEALQSLVARKEKTLERLHKQYKEYEESTEETLSRLRNQVEALQSELEKAMSKIESLEQQLADSDENKIKAETMELELTTEKARHADLLNQYNTATQTMEKTIEALETQNKELSASMDSVSAVEKECDRLRQQLSNAQDQLEAIENDHEEKVKVLEKELATERNNLANYSSGHNEEVSQLSAELRSLRQEKVALENEHAASSEKLAKEMETIEMETDRQLEEKQDLIDKLKEALALKDKSRHVPNSVADVSFSKRDQLKDVNDELLDVIAQNKAYANEIQKLKTTIQGMEGSKGSSLANQKRRIEELEDEIIALNSELRHQTDRESVGKLKSENSQLREFVRELKIERRQLRERCDAGSEKGVSKSSQMLREKNAKLKQEVEKLTRRLRKVEDSITRVAV